MAVQCFCDGSCKDSGGCRNSINNFKDYSHYYQWPYYQPLPYTRQGWMCPNCGKVHAPWVASCACHVNITTNVPTVFTTTSSNKQIN